MNCKDKESNLCTESFDPKCIEYTGILGNSTKITQPCVNQNMVNEDLYSILDDIPKRRTVNSYFQMKNETKNTNISYLVINDEDRSMSFTRYEYWVDQDIYLYINTTLD